MNQPKQPLTAEQKAKRVLVSMACLASEYDREGSPVHAHIIREARGSMLRDTRMAARLYDLLQEFDTPAEAIAKAEGRS